MRKELSERGDIRISKVRGRNSRCVAADEKIPKGENALRIVRRSTKKDDVYDGVWIRLENLEEFKEDLKKVLKENDGEPKRIKKGYNISTSTCETYCPACEEEIENGIGALTLGFTNYVRLHVGCSTRVMKLVEEAIEERGKIENFK